MRRWVILLTRLGMNKKLIEAYGWEYSERQPDSNYFRFVREESILDVWKTGTVRFIREPFGLTKYFKGQDLEDILLAVDSLSNSL